MGVGRGCVPSWNFTNIHFSGSSVCCLSECLINSSFVFLSLLRLISLEYYLRLCLETIEHGPLDHLLSNRSSRKYILEN